MSLEDLLPMSPVHTLSLAAAIHMPRIGCGLAGGDWSEIEPIIHDELSKHDVAVTVYDFP